MPNSDESPNALDALAALGRRADPGIKAVLLRVLVDLFVSQAHHTPDEIKQFEEIGLRVVDDADPSMRAIVARKLAAYPSAPHTLMTRLIASGGEAAVILLRDAPGIGRDILAAITAAGTTGLAAAVAERDDLTYALVDGLARRQERTIDLSLAANAKAPLAPATLSTLIDRGRTDITLGAILCERAEAAGTIDMTPLFLAASPKQRQHIVAEAISASNPGEKTRAARRGETRNLAELETYARDRQWEAFQARLERMMAIPHGAGALLLTDPRGDALALALASIGMLASSAARIFLSREPSIAHSYERVSSLVSLVDTLSPAAARRIVVAVLGIGEREYSLPSERTRTAAHQTFADANAAETSSRPGPARTDIRRPATGVRVERLGRRLSRGPS